MLSAFHKLLDNPRFFSFVQTALGARRIYSAVKSHHRHGLQATTHKTVLDVGCGTGALHEMFSGYYAGIDINFEYLKHARREVSRDFVRGDALALPVRSGIISLVFTFGLVHHLSRKERGILFQELWRVCAADGSILVMDGIIPSDRLNVIGYALAKLDRGRYKVRKNEFIDMISEAFPYARQRQIEFMRLYPYELAFALIGK